jgi:triosephosphate isomerase (TIM)
MPAPRKLVAGNWKMNGSNADAEALARAVAAGATAARAEILVCPPFVHLISVARVLGGSAAQLGAQDCHAAAAGAHTGDIAAEMLSDIGCRYVIVGHSERRANHGERDADVKAKIAAAWRAGLCAIACVGETLAERDAGTTLEIIGRQLAGSLPGGANAANLVVAYEPVWAIGTGRTPTTAQVAEVHAAIRAALVARFADGAAMRILYGGSVNDKNAAELMAVANVDGALVGGASLKPDAFAAIVAAAG